MTNLNKKTWVAIILFSLCGQVAWTVENMLFNVFIQEEFNANLNNIALMVSVSAIAATLTTLFMGAFSDKIGKRKIFICGGYLLWGISIMCFALLKVDIISNIVGNSINAFTLGVTLTILFDCIMTFFGSTANDANFNAWLTDISDSTNRGKVEGVNSAMPLVAILVVFGGKMLVENSKNEWTIIFLTIGIAILIVGIIGCFTIEEPKNIKPSNESYFKNIFYGFKKSVIKENKLLYIVFLGFMIFSISIQVFMPYLILYFTNALELNNYVLIFAPAVVLAAIFTIFYGKFIDKNGFVKSVSLSIIIYLIGLILLSFFSNIIFVFLGTLLMMVGYLSGTAAFNTSIRNYTPENKVGLFQGIRIFISVLIPMIIGPWIGSIISGNTSEGFFGVAGDSYTPSSLIFLGAFIVAILTFIIILLYSKKVEKDA